MSQLCGHARDLQALPMVTEPLVDSSDPFVCGARADEGWLCPVRRNRRPRRAPALRSKAKDRGALSFNQLPTEALGSCGSCKVTADPATFYNWDQVPSWCLERRCQGTEGLLRPGLSTPQEAGGLGFLHLLARIPPLPYLQPSVTSSCLSCPAHGLERRGWG